MNDVPDSSVPPAASSARPNATSDAVHAVDMQAREGDMVPLAKLPEGSVAAGGNLASHPRGEAGASFGGTGVVHAEPTYGITRARPSDDALALAARNAIEQNGHVAPGLVSVEVRGGMVRLSGTVPTSIDRSVAEECVGVLDGVLRIENDLRTPHEAD
jgi:hypothetical protein